MLRTRQHINFDRLHSRLNSTFYKQQKESSDVRKIKFLIYSESDKDILKNRMFRAEQIERAQQLIRSYYKIIDDRDPDMIERYGTYRQLKAFYMRMIREIEREYL